MCNTHTHVGTAKTAHMPRPRSAAPPRLGRSLGIVEAPDDLGSLDFSSAISGERGTTALPPAEHSVKTPARSVEPVGSPREGTPPAVLTPAAQKVLQILIEAAAAEPRYDGKRLRDERNEWRGKVVSQLQEKLLGSRPAPQELVLERIGDVIDRVKHEITRALGVRAETATVPKFLSPLPSLGELRERPKVLAAQAPTTEAPRSDVKTARVKPAEEPLKAPSVPANPAVSAQSEAVAPPKPLHPFVGAALELPAERRARLELLLRKAADLEGQVAGKDREKFQGDVLQQLHLTIFGGQTPARSEALKPALKKKIVQGLDASLGSDLHDLPAPKFLGIKRA